MQNWQQTILSQYANSPALLSLIESMNDAIDPTANIDEWYSMVWDVSTAVGYGLDVWGRIVGVSRDLLVPLTSGFFGFKTGAVPETSLPLGFATFYPGTSSTQVYRLSDANYRLLIYVKALANISRTTIPSLNRLLVMLFGGIGFVAGGPDTLYVVGGYVDDGYIETISSAPPGYPCYVIDNGNMVMTYYFEFELSDYQVAIITQSGVMPRPTGVKAYLSRPVGGMRIVTPIAEIQI